MPLYEYQCEVCGNRFEVIQKFSDPSVDICKICGGTVHRLLSAPAIQFKGTGWYITDYARKGKTDPDSAASSKSDSASKAGGSDGGSTSASGSTADKGSTSDKGSGSTASSTPSTSSGSSGSSSGSSGSSSGSSSGEKK